MIEGSSVSQDVRNFGRNRVNIGHVTDRPDSTLMTYRVMFRGVQPLRSPLDWMEHRGRHLDAQICCLGATVGVKPGFRPSVHSFPQEGALLAVQLHA
jgi:hypothetical protein